MLHALCFSMNRPLQLDGYLRSVRRFMHPMPTLSVLFRATTPIFRDGYDEIARKHPDVRFIAEHNFTGQLVEWLNQAGPLVVFGCDDVLFVRPVDVASATALLREEKELLACSLRLGCNIRFSHNTPEEIPKPAFQQIGDLLIWNWRQEKSHWNYPFELNGTIYRHDFIVRLLNELEGWRSRQPAAEWRHPNLLELRGNEWLLQARCGSLMCCLMESALVVPTVNCVQSYFDNPLLGAAQDIQALETRRREGWELDLDAFHAKRYDRIHVGDFHLHQPKAVKTKSADVKWLREARVENPALSIIMAAWQAEQYIGEAIRSILEQSGLEFELIVVDDASTDATLQTTLAFDDPRLAVGCLSERLKAGAVRNLGIQKARAPWICIFDSDDVMEPRSLAAYYKAVAAHEARDWAYCGLRLVNAEGHDLNTNMRTPFELLRALQRNVIAHPMCLYTRKLFDRAGGYDETMKQAEDYDLWLRFLFFTEPFFHDRLCVRYRRHANSIGESVQREQSLAPQPRLRALLESDRKYREAPNARRIQTALAFLETAERRQWNETIGLGAELAALGCAGFELDRRMVEAFTGLGQQQQALALAFQWLQKMSAGANLLPYEQVWTMVSCLNLLRTTGRHNEVKSLLPLAKIIHDQQPNEELARAMSAAG